MPRTHNLLTTRVLFDLCCIIILNLHTIMNNVCAMCSTKPLLWFLLQKLSLVPFLHSAFILYYISASFSCFAPSLHCLLVSCTSMIPYYLQGSKCHNVWADRYISPSQQNHHWPTSQSFVCVWYKSLFPLLRNQS